MLLCPPRPTLFPYTTLFRSLGGHRELRVLAVQGPRHQADVLVLRGQGPDVGQRATGPRRRSEEHTSELQSHSDLVCRLLLEKKKKKNNTNQSSTQHTATVYM